MDSKHEYYEQYKAQDTQLILEYTSIAYDYFEVKNHLHLECFRCTCDKYMKRKTEWIQGTKQKH